MMPSFSQNKWYAIFFVSYLCTMLYVMMNLMLAVVNETFTSRERDKFKKLFLHKRKACQHAFKLLVSKQNPNKMRFRQFEGLIRYYAPNKCTYTRLFFSDKISPITIALSDARTTFMHQSKSFVSVIFTFLQVREILF